jgi:hypothetical protein
MPLAAYDALRGSTLCAQLKNDRAAEPDIRHSRCRADSDRAIDQPVKIYRRRKLALAFRNVD